MPRSFLLAALAAFLTPCAVAAADATGAADAGVADARAVDDVLSKSADDARAQLQAVARACVDRVKTLRPAQKEAWCRSRVQRDLDMAKMRHAGGARRVEVRSEDLSAACRKCRQESDKAMARLVDSEREKTLEYLHQLEEKLQRCPTEAPSMLETWCRELGGGFTQPP